jgi:ubiquinone biosynthesis protein
MRLLASIGRCFTMGFVVWWFATAYGLGRLRTLFVRGREARRRAVASLRGRILRRALTALGATFVKLGQVLSTRPDLLDVEIIEELRHLQDRLHPFSFARARRIIEEDLQAPLESCFAELDPHPVAAASVAQVHRGRLHNGDEVAVKVLRPDVRQKVERDATILLSLARAIAWHPRWRLSDPVGHLRHFAAGILEQTNLATEVENYSLFRRHFDGFSGVRFPRVYEERCGPRVMVMEYLRGAKVDALPPGDHRELAVRILQIVLKMCFDDGFVHADLHPGNLLLHESGDLVIFDVGLVKQLHEDLLIQFIDFTRCIVMGGPQDLLQHLRRFHTYAKDVDWVALEKDIGEFILRFRGQNVGELEIGAMMNDIYAMGRRFRVRPLPEMTLVIVGLVTAQGIGKQLHPEQNLFAEMSAYLMPLLARKGLAVPMMQGM